MTRRATVAWALWTVFMLVVAAHGVLEVLNGRTGEYLGSITILIGFTAFATVGVLVASRRPGNGFGWIYLFGALGAMVGNLAGAYSDYALKTRPGSLPGGVWAQWLGSLSWLPSVAVLVVFSLLLFPDGRPTSPRWRPVLWTAAAGVLMIAASTAFAPGPIENFKGNPPNPAGIAAAGTVIKLFEPVSIFLLLGATLGAVVSLFFRYRRASGNERQQLKWLAWSGAVMITCLLLQGPSNTFIGDWPGNYILFPIALLSVPLGTGIAIFRYRLYDIDRIISRTLSYALVTVVLGGLFALMALLIPTMFLTTRRTPDWIIAAATLVVAALFRPVRRRVQNTVDHRFNRSRYNAERTIDTFSARLREEIDIDALGAELQDLVGRTMQPTHVSLWLNRDGT